MLVVEDVTRPVPDVAYNMALFPVIELNVRVPPSESEDDHCGTLPLEVSTVLDPPIPSLPTTLVAEAYSMSPCV